MVLRETNDNGEEVSIVVEQVVAWKCAHKRITVFAGSHTFAFFGEAASRLESKLRARLGEVPASFVPPGSASAAA
jgi:hypothetical protein